MNNFLGYRCSLCEREYLPTQVSYTCPRDGGNLDVILDIERLRKIKPSKDNEPGLWHYLPWLPVADPGGMKTPLRMAGGTPIYDLNSLATYLGLQRLWLKDESRNPSASFKDRASAVVIAHAHEIDAETVVTASTGNAGAALACMAATIGQKAVIFAPRSAPTAKIAQLQVFGAQVFLVEGTYDEAFDLSIQAAQEFGWYCRNTGYNPFTAEGKKTAAFEIWDFFHTIHEMCIFVSVGDGNIISGIHKGFKDLLALGWIEHIPRLFGVQAEGSAAITNAFYAQTETIKPIKAKTVADSIAVDLPCDGIRAVRAARQTEGGYITVSDKEILQAIATLGKVGVFAEPAGAAAYAGLAKAVAEDIIQPNTPVLVFNTGSGLKDVQAAMQAVPESPIIEPRLEALRRMIK